MLSGLAALVTLTALAVAGYLLLREPPIPNRDPTGQTFPAVTGKALTGRAVDLPAALAGRPAVLLVGYRQRAQFDIDRWLLGLLQAGVDTQLLELPTIPALGPTLFSEQIDDGMRAGIPREDWDAVVTLYGSAARPVAELTGTTGGSVARVLVLDGDGRIVWFDDRGYSARKALEIGALLDRLAADASRPAKP